MSDRPSPRAFFPVGSTPADGAPGSIIVWVLAPVAAITILTWYAGAALLPAVGSLVAVYTLGYVSGALLVEPPLTHESLPLGVVRLLAGLFATAIAFLLSTLLTLPWYTGPAVVLAASLLVHRRAVFALPRIAVPTRDGMLGLLLAALVLLPVLVSAGRMAPGEFPPVFFSVDTPYFLEKVHSLVLTDTFPPESLGVAGGQRSYHFGAHAVAAVISRASGLLPHHALFLVLVPLLLAGVVAAAWLVARRLGPAVPVFVSVPLLVVTVPTLWYDGWARVWPGLAEAAASGSLGPLQSAMQNWETWGATFNVQNLTALFLVLASIAGIAASTAQGWRLPVFLIGASVLFKTPAAVALASGFSLAQAWSAVTARSFKPLLPAAAAAAVFGAVFGAFWVIPAVPPDMELVLRPGFLTEYLDGGNRFAWFAADATWLLLPALVLLIARAMPGRVTGLSPSLLLFAVAPLIVINVLRTADLRGAYGVSSMNEDDWRQILIPVPVFLHALVLSVVGERWVGLGRGLRRTTATLVLLAVLPVAYVAVRHTAVIISSPQDGHEFASNQSMGQALAAVPTENSLIVTNSLRYPANGFSRDERQMQIPALFGHQAFAVNYFYEAYPFSPERRELQRLLESDEWNESIDVAAREHGWTHLLIRKDYPYPEPIPLELVFDGREYAVYRF